MERVAPGLIDHLTERGIARCALVGYSMGGRVALYLARHFPERFDAVVFESASPGLRTERERRERRAHDASLARRLLEIPLERFLREWYDRPLFATLHGDPERFARLIERRGTADPAGLAASLRWMGTGMQPSLWEELEEITAPVLLITGEKDATFRGFAAAMRARIPAARHEVVAGAGHTVHWEKPAAFVRLVGQFLTT